MYKSLYKIFIILLKYIPILLVGIYLLNTTLSYIAINTTVLSYIVHFIILSFMVYSSIVCKFCKWHRCCIYYIILVDIINCIDEYIHIPISDYNFFKLHLMLFGIALIYIIKNRNKQ